jgi:hypothetical protein
MSEKLKCAIVSLIPFNGQWGFRQYTRESVKIYKNWNIKPTVRDLGVSFSRFFLLLRKNNDTPPPRGHEVWGSSRNVKS